MGSEEKRGEEEPLGRVREDGGREHGRAAPRTLDPDTARARPALQVVGSGRKDGVWAGERQAAEEKRRWRTPTPFGRRRKGVKEGRRRRRTDGLPPGVLTPQKQNKGPKSSGPPSLSRARLSQKRRPGQHADRAGVKEGGAISTTPAGRAAAALRPGHQVLRLQQQLLRPQRLPPGCRA
jgi:hypothetical protein